MPHQVVRGTVEYSILSGMYRGHTAMYWHWYCHLLSSPTARVCPHSSLQTSMRGWHALLTEPKYVNWADHMSGL